MVGIYSGMTFVISIVDIHSQDLKTQNLLPPSTLTQESRNERRWKVEVVFGFRKEAQNERQRQLERSNLLHAPDNYYYGNISVNRGGAVTAGADGPDHSGIITYRLQ